MRPMEIDPTNREQQLAYNLIAHTNSSFFLTGCAGTGKTTFLHNVQNMVKKNFVTLAPTGVAAILAGGETIHSFFGLPLEVCQKGLCGHMGQERIMTLLHADTIIIDEVSMVRCDIMDAVDCTMRRVLRNNSPFGGKQMVFVGDMFQLAPVVQGAEQECLKDMYNTEEFFFYKSEAVSRMRLVKIEFRKVYRQEDERFLQILEHVRQNCVTEADLAQLNSRVASPQEGDGLVMTLSSTNKIANAVNQKRLEELDSKEYAYEGIVSGEFDARRFPVEAVLRLREGAQVMFTRNDTNKRWANGTLGVVSHLTADEIQVTLENGETYSVPSCTWESFDVKYNKETKKLTKEVKGTFTQFPLKLAWAITVHKSQGSTFAKMNLEIGWGMSMPGQLYVALSRVRSLDGLFLSKKVYPQYARTSRDILAYASGYNDIHQIDREIESGKMVYEALRRDDYDEVARKYLLLVEKCAQEGEVREALYQAKRFLDVVICDEDLYGCIGEIPSELQNGGHWSVHFLVALLALYARRYDMALEHIECVLSCHECQEALYVKSRALEKLERYKEADEVNVILINRMDREAMDGKVMYMVAMLNEMHLSDPGLEIMGMLVGARPKYDRAILAMRMLMHRKNVMLEGETELNRELVEAFNSEMGEKDFLRMLKEQRESAPKAVRSFVRCIKEQQFDTL